ncbi:TlpA family protein disulfide reductase [Nocardiopsis aegyptia]|uniref:Thiol-disulfide isomerase/thioredoxin n=1 Tax=Nocardiopsis aegyptia TaxID=220378 RepID=A0A7Z0JB77_9ACTN|nr:redoxin domain-containing protein [Nocardiopsis aegyptia]NYJ36048.1 thiol-disulfide isomerase/thioredoxin [Nocardiopsis aegyptia]
MIRTPAPTDDAAGRAYRFERFRTGLLLSDMSFPPDAPGAGDRIPAFDLATLDGPRFTSTDLGPLPVLLVFGSRTCPVTESAGPVLRRLHEEFGAAVRFVLVNTREAHPGQLVPQPRTFERKWEHALDLRRHHALRFEVAVDGIDGEAHRAFGPKPNSAYLVDPDGTIRYRAHWANDEGGLREALSAAVLGRAPARGHSRGMAGSLLRAVGHLPGTVRAAGSRVERDVWLAAPPLALLGRLSLLFGRLPADRRGAAAAAALLGFLLTVALVVLLL